MKRRAFLKNSAVLSASSIWPAVLSGSNIQALKELPALPVPTLAQQAWQASEIGRLVVFLASKDGDFINGKAINIDGGVTLTSVPAWFPLNYTKASEVDWKGMHQHFPYAEK